MNAIASSLVLDQVDSGRLDIALQGETYLITKPVVKEYAASRYLVKSSGTPIDLGEEMFPFMELNDLREFLENTGQDRADDSPQEIYLYEWVERAQGPMIFKTGVLIESLDETTLEDSSFVIAELPPLKVSSLLYVGPFPWQDDSGWENIDWEERAANAGLRYDEKLYRELYHRYDWENNRHVTEIEITIE